MLDRLPLRWLGRGVAPPNATAFRGEASRGEFFVFQLGEHAPLRPKCTAAATGEET